ncbi:MAG: AMP-binding protein, partial [Desulfohalobiaceae bacterium]
GLTRAGVDAGEAVALFAPNSPAWITACLGAILAGVVVVPMDAQLRGKTLEHVLKDSGVSLVFTTSDRRDRVQELRPECRVVLLDGEERDQAHWSNFLSGETGQAPGRKGEDTALLFYTSGTTGPPKGVPLSQRNICSQLGIIAEAELILSSDRALLPLPLHHVYPFVVGLLAPLWFGLPVALPASLTGPELIRAIRESKASLIIGVPRLYRALVDGISSRASSAGFPASMLFTRGLSLSKWLHRHNGPRIGHILFRSLHQSIGPELRILASGGAAIDPELALTLQGLGWNVAIGYGLTETSPLLTINPPDRLRVRSVGQTVPGVDIRIATGAAPDAGEDGSTPKTFAAGNGSPCEPVGEVQAKGPNVFSGYHDLPDKTKSAFTEPITNNALIHMGGNLRFDPDGYLYLAGRASTLIVTPGGENIQPDSVEDAYSEHPFIREAGLVQEEERLIALVVPSVGEIRRQGLDDVDQAVRRAVNERGRELPSYQRPEEVVVTRKSLPRTRLGKIRRHLLQDRLEQARSEEAPSTGQQEISLEELPEEDRSLLETPEARSTWDLLAERFPDRPLHVDASPQYDLGLDSLEWLNLTLQIRERTGAELDEAAISRIDTVRDLLEAVVESAGAGPGALADPLDDPEEVLTDIQKKWLKPRGPVIEFLGRVMLGMIRFVVGRIFGLTVQGKENIPSHGPVVLLPNHQSYLDPLVLAACLDIGFLDRTYWAGWTGVMFRNPLARFLSRITQVVPIDPQRAARSSLAFGAVVLKRERNLVWFPEGQRSPNGTLLPFKPGLGLLLDRYPVTVVPVAIQGTHQALPPGRAWPRRVRFTVTFGSPWDGSALEEERAPQHILQALRDRLLELLPEGADSKEQGGPHA